MKKQERVHRFLSSVGEKEFSKFDLDRSKEEIQEGLFP